MLNDFSEQDIASVTEWLTKIGCRNSGMLLNLNDLASLHGKKKRPRGGAFEQRFGPGGGEFDR